jgi:ABC-type Fe3+-hydroxamate transport system substrate-binding protein
MLRPPSMRCRGDAAEMPGLSSGGFGTSPRQVCKSGRVDKNACSLSWLSGMKFVHLFRYRFLTPAAAVCLLCVMLFALSCHKTDSHASEPRYVVLSPEIAEIIAVIEGTDNVIGITEECTWPESYANKQVVGKFGTLNRELIISLKPSLVFASSLEQQSIASELAKLGIKVISVYPQTIEEMLSGIITVGEALGKRERAVFVADSLRAELDGIRNNAIPEHRRKVYLEIYREPLMSVSDRSFVGELIELAGGDNIFDELERDYCRISSEDVIQAKPDIIICYSQDTASNIAKRMGWKDIPAVRSGRIYFEQDINPDWLLRAGPRVILGAGRLQEIFREATL